MKNVVFICSSINRANYEFNEFIKKFDPQDIRVNKNRMRVTFKGLCNYYFISDEQAHIFFMGRRNYVVKYL